MQILINGDRYFLSHATERDQSQIRDLIFAILIEYGLKPDPTGVDRDLFDIKNAYHTGYFGVLRSDEGIIIASFGLYNLTDNIAEIRKMYLHRDFRGNGIGEWMVKYLIQKAMDMDFQYLELETASPLIEAIGLYRKFGFVEKDIPNRTPRCDKSFTLKLR